MSKTKKKFDEFYEKPSKHRGWMERGDAPVITRNMNGDDIRKFAVVLAQSFTGATPEDIKFEFERIADENDEDRTDCIWLRYFIKCINSKGEPDTKNIYNVKIPVPERLRGKSEQASATAGPKRAPARARALPAPGGGNGETTHLPPPPQPSPHSMRHPHAAAPFGTGLPAYNPPPVTQPRRRPH
jgi:hypothetical protein